jgi:hypothetical protein
MHISTYLQNVCVILKLLACDMPLWYTSDCRSHYYRVSQKFACSDFMNVFHSYVSEYDVLVYVCYADGGYNRCWKCPPYIRQKAKFQPLSTGNFQTH